MGEVRTSFVQATVGTSLTEPQTPIPTAPPSVLLQPRGVGSEHEAEVAGLRPRRPAGEGEGARVPLLILRMPVGSHVRSPCSREEQPARGARAVKAELGGGASVAEPRGGRGLRKSARAGRGFSPGEGPWREGAWPAPRSLSTPPENFPLGLWAPKPA